MSINYNSSILKDSLSKGDHVALFYESKIEYITQLSNIINRLNDKEKICIINIFDNQYSKNYFNIVNKNLLKSKQLIITS